ncbi:MAG: NADH-quinone oxidoreductase subunit C [Myxococcales bacterium]|nr:NADH-quinone oxidoreductase subunit C [Myxococcales bacterium]
MNDPQATLAEFMAERFGLAVDPWPEGGPLVPLDQHLVLAQALKDAGYTLYGYCVASHWPEEVPKKGDPIPEHYEVATGLRRPGKGTHMAMWRVWVDMGQGVPSLADVFPGADFQEREQFDLVGVVFDGHPDPRRLMLPEEWVGHPLRKDYAIDTGHLPWR